MWSIGRDAGLPSDEFWELTFKEFAALQDRAREREERAFLRTGVIASTIANCHRDPERKRDAYTPADFMPAGMVPKQAPPTPEDLLEKVRALNAAFGGTDLTQPNEPEH